MTRQKLNKILILSLFIIWSVVGYKFLKTYFGKKELFIPEDISLDNFQGKVAERDTFKLKPLARDPFLDKLFLPETVHFTHTPVSKKTPPQISWPKIEYMGFVQNESNAVPLVILKINNKIKRLRKGEKVDDISIKKIYNDSIELQNMNHRRIFIKN